MRKQEQRLIISFNVLSKIVNKTARRTIEQHNTQLVQWKYLIYVFHSANLSLI